MSCRPILYRTENLIMERELRQKDGSELPFSALTAAKVFLYQGTVLKKTLVMGIDAELRQGDTSNKIVCEVTTAILATLSPGELRVQWHTEVADSAFSVDSNTSRDDESDPDLDFFEIK